MFELAAPDTATTLARQAPSTAVDHAVSPPPASIHPSVTGSCVRLEELGVGMRSGDVEVGLAGGARAGMMMIFAVGWRQG